MAQTARRPHTHIRGEDMERKVHTYRAGNTLIQVVEPLPMTQEEIERVLEAYHAAGWDIIEELAGRGEDV